jgi:hypothetical protein
MFGYNRLSSRSSNEQLEKFVSHLVRGPSSRKVFAFNHKDSLSLGVGDEDVNVAQVVLQLAYHNGFPQVACRSRSAANPKLARDCVHNMQGRRDQFECPCPKFRRQRMSGSRKIALQRLESMNSPASAIPGNTRYDPPKNVNSSANWFSAGSSKWAIDSSEG